MQSPCWLLEVTGEPGQELHLVSPAGGGDGGHGQGPPCWEESQDATDRPTVETEEQEGV